MSISNIRYWKKDQCSGPSCINFSCSTFDRKEIVPFLTLKNLTFPCKTLTNSSSIAYLSKDDALKFGVVHRNCPLDNLVTTLINVTSQKAIAMVPTETKWHRGYHQQQYHVVCNNSQPIFKPARHRRWKEYNIIN